MKVLGALFVAVVVMSLLAVAAVVQLVITLAPLLLLAVIVSLVVRARRPAHPSRSVTGYPVRAAPQPRYQVQAPSPAYGGWVMVPVWVAPAPPRPPVIDAEVIRDGD